ncbi:MAG: hypothetical protein ACRDGJ_04465 [Candidatus Limnocylindria bacterium]
MPLMLSGWLIGGGAALGVLGTLINLFGPFNVADLVLLVVLAAVSASVFLASGLPEIPHLRLMTLAVVLVGFGVALDRIGFGVAGAGALLLLLGTAAASMGAVIVELGRDQPLGGQQA